MKRVNLIPRLSLLLILLHVLSGSGLAAPPTAYGQIAGVVSDVVTGKVIPKAIIILTSPAMMGEASDLTDALGHYRFEKLPPGVYKLTAEAPGYERSLIDSIAVYPNRTILHANLKLSPAPIRGKEIVIRKQAIPEIDTSASSTSMVFSKDYMEQMAVAQQSSDFATSASKTTQPQPQPQPQPVTPPVENNNTENYARITPGTLQSVASAPFSTFSIDVDTAAYSNIRRFLNQGELPPKDAVRVEEMVNYFRYNYPAPKASEPIAIATQVSQCPWDMRHSLLRVGLHAPEIAEKRVQPRNLVFLIDVSGSMYDPLKLPLVVKSLAMMTSKLRSSDRIAIVVYAGSSGLVLPSTPGNQRRAIMDALSALQAGGSTNGGEGIELAYKIAQQNFIKKGINRVILATDGDFNVGINSEGELLRLIEEKKKSGVFLSVLGFGRGNLKDATMEKLADTGDGNYSYIDSLREAYKVLVTEAGSTLMTVAKDVKVQIDFNPKMVQAYRLIGYENRLLAAQAFNDDTKDAGEMGAGHQVTALYELISPGEELNLPKVDPSRYAPAAPIPSETQAVAMNSELLTVKVRYKLPTSAKSQLISAPVLQPKSVNINETTPDHDFAAAVALLGIQLRGEAVSDITPSDLFSMIKKLATPGLAKDPGGHRHEFLELVNKAQQLSTPAPKQ